MVSNPAFQLPAKKCKTKEEWENNFYGYTVPPKINRKLPLQGRSVDPCQCLEVLDDMYGIYNSLQVSTKHHNTLYKDILNFALH
jgi:hypothetical protein